MLRVIYGSHLAPRAGSGGAAVYGSQVALLAGSGGTAWYLWLLGFSVKVATTDEWVS